ncbi:hypothetical protein JCM33374_g3283 [Metschnikowia sp. JCM 33374]|nr:hypothetical protein JCM33374_g3283 [Metschnikowia sp. JCM 33374]
MLEDHKMEPVSNYEPLNEPLNEPPSEPSYVPKYELTPARKSTPTPAPVTTSTCSDSRSAEFKAQLDRFKVFQVQQQCHWKFGEIPQYPLHVGAFHDTAALTPEEILLYTPYKIEWQTAALFPEWYFLFLRHFATKSEFHKLYCVATRASFCSLLIGSDMEKEAVLESLDTQFSSVFNARIGDLFSSMLHNRLLTREVVETEIVKTFADMTSPTPYFKRKHRLIEKVLAGNTQPYVDFLMAYDYADKDIWMAIYGTLLKNIFSREHILAFEEIFEGFVGFNKFNISSLQEFVNTVERRGLIVKGGPKAKPAKPANMKPAKAKPVKPVKPVKPAKMKPFQAKAAKANPPGKKRVGPEETLEPSKRQKKREKKLMKQNERLATEKKSNANDSQNNPPNVSQNNPREYVPPLNMNPRDYVPPPHPKEHVPPITHVKDYFPPNATPQNYVPPINMNPRHYIQPNVPKAQRILLRLQILP